MGLTTPVFGMTIFEVAGTIEGTEGENFGFTADIGPYFYEAILEDQSEAPLTGFDFLFMSITTTTENFGSIFGPGSIFFHATPNTTYFANILGTGGGETQTGVFKIRVVNSTPIPEPSTYVLLAVGLLALLSSYRLVAQKIRQEGI